MYVLQGAGKDVKCMQTCHVMTCKSSRDPLQAVCVDPVDGDADKRLAPCRLTVCCCHDTRDRLHDTRDRLHDTLDRLHNRRDRLHGNTVAASSRQCRLSADCLWCHDTSLFCWGKGRSPALKDGKLTILNSNKPSVMTSMIRRSMVSCVTEPAF